ncbi:MAG: sensory rhodopsin transducer [Bacillota bacterium]
MAEHGNHGAKIWYIPDAYLPSSGLGEKWEGHESVCILNATDRDAHIKFTLYFEDREPVSGISYTLRPQRCKHVGMHKPELLGGFAVPRDVPYAIKVESDQDIIVQYSRLDVTQPNFTLMTAIPYHVK